MLRRLFVGLIEGLIVGMALAIAAARGLGLTAPGALVGALLAGIAGLVVGLVAGRPIWARDAKIEALLKAVVGALLGVGAWFALGRFLALPLDLRAYSLGTGPAGELAVVSLPLIASLLATFFELDNTGGNEQKPRLAAAPDRQRLAEPDEAMSDLDRELLEDLPTEHKHEKR